MKFPPAKGKSRCDNSQETSISEPHLPVTNVTVAVRSTCHVGNTTQDPARSQRSFCCIPHFSAASIFRCPTQKGTPSQQARRYFFLPVFGDFNGSASQSTLRTAPAQGGSSARNRRLLHPLFPNTRNGYSRDAAQIPVGKAQLRREPVVERAGSSPSL